MLKWKLCSVVMVTTDILTTDYVQCVYHVQCVYSMPSPAYSKKVRTVHEILPRKRAIFHIIDNARVLYYFT